MTRFVAILSALAATIALAGPVHAQDFSPVVVSKAVKTGDLDLNSPAGAIKALARIERIARQVCALDSTSFSAAQASNQRACAEAATIAAVQGARSPVLSAALSARLGATQIARR